jgi:hypothetical protein
LTSWTPSQWKGSPYYITLRKFGAISCCHCCCCHHCHWLQTWCMSIDRTNRWAPCTMWNFPIDSWEHKPAQSLGKLIFPPKTEQQQTVHCNLTQQWSGLVEHWKCTRERVKGKELISVPKYL